jgi:hypothetical protein
LEAGDEVALGDAPEAVGIGGSLGVPDGDGHEAPGFAGHAQRVDDGEADAGGIHSDCALAGSGELTRHASDVFDYGCVGRAEREAFEVAHLEVGDPGTLPRDGIRDIGDGDGPFDDGDGGAIATLAEIDACEVFAQHCL